MPDMPLNATAVPGRIVDGFPPRLDGRLEVDRAPCIGEMMTLRSTLVFALDSRLATLLGVTELRGELWLEYPSDILSIMTARPSPTRVEGHGRPGGRYAVVWEDVVLRAGLADERTITFRSDGESFGYRQFSSFFVRAGDGEGIGLKNVGGGDLFVRFGSQDEHPEAVRSLLDIGPDRPSRCATPGAGVGVDADVDVESEP
jgi:hypothetical protein